MPEILDLPHKDDVVTPFVLEEAGTVEPRDTTVEQWHAGAAAMPTHAIKAIIDWRCKPLRKFDLIGA